VHPVAACIDGVKCFRSFAEIPEPVSALIVVVPPAQAITVVRDAHAAGIHRVWLQQGSESPAVLKVCRDLGVDVIAGECVLMFAQPTSYHWVHARCEKLFSRAA
jgi:predicted CoA-binding protein